jgi:hypothetical protein
MSMREERGRLSITKTFSGWGQCPIEVADQTIALPRIDAYEIESHIEGNTTAAAAQYRDDLGKNLALATAL